MHQLLPEGRGSEVLLPHLVQGQHPHLTGGGVDVDHGEKTTIMLIMFTSETIPPMEKTSLR